MKNGVEVLEKKVYQYKREFLDLFTQLGFGHLTSAFSWAEIATVLYNEILKLPPVGESFAEYDKMVVSKAHGAGILFPIFQDVGLMEKDEIKDAVRIGGSNARLRQLYYPAFDFYGGSLGIGLGLACGLAKGAKLKNARWRVFCLLGDAECYEGSIWEAAGFAGHQQLNNLIAIIDRNKLGCSDFTEKMLRLEPLADKWRCFGWDVYEADGHSVEELYNTFVKALDADEDKPKCIIANTRKGNGLDYLIDRPLMHGYMPKGEEAKRAYRDLK